MSESILYMSQTSRDSNDSVQARFLADTEPSRVHVHRLSARNCMCDLYLTERCNAMIQEMP